MDWIESFFAILFVAVLGSLGVFLRLLPGIISKGVEKSIEHVYDKKLEGLKGDIQASNSALKSSVDYLAASQAELRSKVLSSVENLWQAIDDLQTAYSKVGIGLLSILTSEELDDCFGGRATNPHIRAEFKALEEGGILFFADTLKTIKNKLSGSEVFYVSSRLWFLYETIRRVHGRIGFLIGVSLREKKYRDWRFDKVMMSSLAEALSSDRIDHAKSRPVGGLNEILSWLMAEFVKEGSDVVRGSAEFEKSVSQIHSTLKVQVEDRHRREN